jgi:hypothetical protein
MSRFLINNSSTNQKECAMKKLFLTLVTFSILFVIGCQENSITDPLTVEPTNKVQQTDPSNQGTITLERMLTDPYPVMNSYFIINGAIEYEHTLGYLDPIPPNPQYVVSLNLSVTADLTYFCTVCSPSDEDASVGSISSESNDEMSISIWEDEIFLLEKSFPIQGREDGMVLKCTFHVTTIGVGLDEMWLELPDGNSNYNASNWNDLSRDEDHNPICIYPAKLHVTQ